MYTKLYTQSFYCAKRFKLPFLIQIKRIIISNMKYNTQFLSLEVQIANFEVQNE